MQIKDSKPKSRAGAPKCNETLGATAAAGRTPIYSEKLLPIVQGMASDGATDLEIADRLGISKETLRWWRRERIEFANAMKVGREAMVERAKASLFHRAVGYSFRSEKVFQSQGAIIRAPIIEHVPPDVAAAKMILQAYDTEDVWRDKKDLKAESDLLLGGSRRSVDGRSRGQSPRARREQAD